MKRQGSKGCLLLVSAVLTGGLALAAPAQEAVDGLAGRYAFDVDRKGQAGCAISLTAEGNNGEYRIALPEPCRRVFPFLETIRGWAPRQLGFAFIAQGGGVAGVFVASGALDYSGSIKRGGPGTEQYFIMGRFPEHAEDARAIVEEMDGKWRLWARAEDGAPNCDIQLVPPDAESGPVATLPAICSAALPSASAIRSWSVDHPWRLNLVAVDGTAVRFGWANYGVYVAPSGPALTRVYGD